jgi:hypothetical protein
MGAILRPRIGFVNYSNEYLTHAVIDATMRPWRSCASSTKGSGIRRTSSASTAVAPLVDRGPPVAQFSGGSLMVGTVGRTDLLGDDQREER